MVAVFAGLVLAHGVQCDSAVGTTVSTGHACTGGAQHGEVMVPTGMTHDAPRTDTGRGYSDALGLAISAPTLLAMVVVPDSPGPGGLLGTCLTLVLGAVVMAVYVGLRPILRKIRGVPSNLRRVAQPIVVHPRASSLAELCLLRT